MGCCWCCLDLFCIIGIILIDIMLWFVLIENYFLINVYMMYLEFFLLFVIWWIFDSGCNLVDVCLVIVGCDVLVIVLVIGLWDLVVKFEVMFICLECEEGLKLVWYCIGVKQVQFNLLFYIVEVIVVDKFGILFQLVDFFDCQGIIIENLQSMCYCVMQIGVEMFFVQVIIGVFVNMYIVVLCDDFFEFCDYFNLDVIMDLMKF